MSTSSSSAAERGFQREFLKIFFLGFGVASIFFSIFFINHQENTVIAKGHVIIIRGNDLFLSKEMFYDVNSKFLKLDDGKYFANAKKTAQEERENCHSKDHDCATVVEHIVWGFGKPVYESHAVPTDDGYVSWYDVEFEHGIEKEVPTEDLKIYTTEAHEKKEKDKKKMLPAKKGKHSDDDEEMDEEKYSDSEIQRAVEIAKKMAGSNYTGASNAIEKMKKISTSIKEGALAFLKAEYRLLFFFVIIASIGLFIICLLYTSDAADE